MWSALEAHATLADAMMRPAAAAAAPRRARMNCACRCDDIVCSSVDPWRIPSTGGWSVGVTVDMASVVRHAIAAHPMLERRFV